MNYSHPESSLYTPDNISPETALERTTHLGIGAHPDAILARRKANAVLENPFQTDSIQSCIYGLDLTPLIQESAPPAEKYPSKIMLDYQSAKLKNAGF